MITVNFAGNETQSNISWPKSIEMYKNYILFSLFFMTASLKIILKKLNFAGTDKHTFDMKKKN